MMGLGHDSWGWCHGAGGDGHEMAAKLPAICGASGNREDVRVVVAIMRCCRSYKYPHFLIRCLETPPAKLRNPLYDVIAVEISSIEAISIATAVAYTIIIETNGCECRMFEDVGVSV